MKKLDDIPKKQPFSVPEDYFDALPGKIQARIQGQTRERSVVFKPAVRYAMAVVMVAALAFVWYWSGPNGDPVETPETILASLETADLIAYLNEGDITTDELLDNVQLDNEDADEIEGTVFTLDLGDIELNELVDEVD